MQKQNFQKNKVDIGKAAFFVISPFCSPYSICLDIGFWEDSFVWTCYAFNHSTINYKTILQFFKEKVFVFQKICFNIEVFKTFKISSDYHMKNAGNTKYSSFRRTYALSVGFKMKPLRKSILCYGKNQLKLCCKSCRKEQLFTFHLFDELLYSNTLFNLSLIEIYALIELVFSTYEKCLI